jgi:Secretin and TonB N terminus short domain
MKGPVLVVNMILRVGRRVQLLPALAQAVEAAVALTADIPAQPLAQALAGFADQTGLQFVYVSDVVRNRKSHAASAGLSAQDALARILEGTGLRFEFLTARTVRILAAAPARVTATTRGAEEPYEIIVTANRREEMTGSNLSNSDAATNITSSQFIKATVPLRPRVLMAEFSRRCPKRPLITMN